MDPVSIGLAVVGLLVAVGAWLWPRQPKALDPPAAPAPAPAPSTPAEPAKGLKVAIKQGVVGFPTGPEWMLFIEAANPNQRPVKAEAFGLELEGTGHHMTWWNPTISRPLPHVLNETDTIQAWSPIGELGRSLLKGGVDKPLRIRGWVRDSYDEKHYSGWMNCNPVEWAKDKKKEDVDK
jgi:hypothetical protein